MQKFNKGDRVIVKPNCLQDTYNEKLLTIVQGNLRRNKEIWYEVEETSYMNYLQEWLELEAIYNSPLRKALKE